MTKAGVMGGSALAHSSPSLQDVFISVYGCRKFHPFAPRLEEIDITAIAVMMSQTPRFGGSLNQDYSLAQHCVLVASQVSEPFQLCALLHDAHEVLDGLGDVLAPVKQHFPELVAHGHNVQLAIAERFGFPWPMPDEVKRADELLGWTEMRDFGLGGHVPAGAPVLQERLEAWPREEVLQAFLDMFNTLTQFSADPSGSL